MKISLNWTDFKTNFSDKGFTKENIHYFLKGERYNVFISDEPFLFTSSFDQDSPEGIEFEASYKPAKQVKAHPKTSTTGVPKVAIEKPDDSSTTMVSHDWCDACTWYQTSTRTTGLTPTLKSGTSNVWELGAKNIIDLKHGRLYGEDNFADTYHIKVYDGGTEIVEGQDYSVNYDLGEITIDASYVVQGTITADFSKAENSEFILEPTPGKILILEHTELNFSADAAIDKIIDFEIWVGNPYFNPAQPISVTNPLRVKYKKIAYKNEKDVINSSNLGQGFIPKFGGMLQDVLVFPFNYLTVTPLKSSQLTQLRIHLHPDKDTNGNMTPLTGSFGTISFYVISRDE